MGQTGRSLGTWNLELPYFDGPPPRSDRQRAAPAVPPEVRPEDGDDLPPLLRRVGRGLYFARGW